MTKKNGKKHHKKALKRSLLAELSLGRELAEVRAQAPSTAESPSGWAATSPVAAPAAVATPRGAASLSGEPTADTQAPGASAPHDSPVPAADEHPGPEAAPLSAIGRCCLGGYLAAVNLACLFGVTWSWSGALQTGEGSDIESALLWLVLFAGGLGACIHALQSFTAFAGNDELVVSWVPWYMLRPLIGMSLAFLAYVIVSMGLFDSTASGVKPAGVAAMGGLAGLFSKRALQKMSEVSNTIFRVAHPHEEKDPLRAQAGQGSNTPTPPSAP